MFESNSLEFFYVFFLISFNMSFINFHGLISRKKQIKIFLWICFKQWVLITIFIPIMHVMNESRSLCSVLCRHAPKHRILTAAKQTLLTANDGAKHGLELRAFAKIYLCILCFFSFFAMLLTACTLSYWGSSSFLHAQRVNLKNLSLKRIDW